MFFDNGLNFLIAFFIFWTVLILSGLFLEFFELGFRRGHFIERSREIYHEFLKHLSEPPHKKRRS